MKPRTITFRQIFITLCILMVANICVNVFQGATTPANHSYDDEMLENMKAYQLDVLDNGDVIVYQHNRPVGVIKYHPHCDLHKIIDADND